MAAPSYTEDLTDINLAESTTGWFAYGGGGAGLSASPDLSVQGTNCVDKQITNADRGQGFNNGTGITLGAGEHIFIWHFCGTPGLTDTRANKGASVLVGTGTGAYCQYHIEGNDTYGASGEYKDMSNFETVILKSTNAALNDNYYNRSHGDGKFFCSGHTKETRQKMSETWKAKEEYYCDPDKAHKAWTGQTHSEESKAKMRKSAKKHSKKRSLRMSKNNPMKNPEVIKKMLETRERNKELRDGGTIIES